MQIQWTALRNIMIGSLLLTTIFAATQRASAQTGTNLLANPSMEKPYNGNGVSPTETAPIGWTLWASETSVVSFAHIDPAQIHSGAAAWNLHASNVYSAGGYQQITGVPVGSTLHATVFAQAYTCADTTYSCIGSDGKHHSNTSSGMFFKVGIDPSGGTSYSSTQIAWSPQVTAFDSWGEPAVDAINCSTTVTIFTYVGESTAMFINSAYFDDASLVITATGANTTVTPCGIVNGGTPGAIVSTPVPAFAPFVTKQAGEQPDGSIIHVVQPGDTLAAIGYAYGVTLDQIRQLNNIQPGDNMLRLGQKIIVKGPTGAAPATVPSAAPTNGPINSLVPSSGNTGVTGAIGGVPTVAPAPPTGEIEFF